MSIRQQLDGLVRATLVPATQAVAPVTQQRSYLSLHRSRARRGLGRAQTLTETVEGRVCSIKQRLPSGKVMIRDDLHQESAVVSARNEQSRTPFE